MPGCSRVVNACFFLPIVPISFTEFSHPLFLMRVSMGVQAFAYVSILCVRNRFAFVYLVFYVGGGRAGVSIECHLQSPTLCSRCVYMYVGMPCGGRPEV